MNQASNFAKKNQFQKIQANFQVTTIFDNNNENIQTKKINIKPSVAFLSFN